MNSLYTSRMNKIRIYYRHGAIATDRTKQGRAVVPGGFTATPPWLPQSLTSYPLASVLSLDLKYNPTMSPSVQTSEGNTLFWINHKYWKVGKSRFLVFHSFGFFCCCFVFLNFWLRSKINQGLEEFIGAKDSYKKIIIKNIFAINKFLISLLKRQIKLPQIDLSWQYFPTWCKLNLVFQSFL